MAAAGSQEAVITDPPAVTCDAIYRQAASHMTTRPTKVRQSHMAQLTQVTPVEVNCAARFFVRRSEAPAWLSCGTSRVIRLAKSVREGYMYFGDHCLTAVTCPGLEGTIRWERETAWTLATVEVTGCGYRVGGCGSQ